MAPKGPEAGTKGPEAGTKSLAAKFAARGRPDDFCINGTDPYAELWMGTHPNGPSMLKGSVTSVVEFCGRDSKGASF